MGDPGQPVTARYRRYIAACNDRDFDGLGEFVAEDVNGPAEGLRRYVDGLRSVVAGFPDYHWTVEQTVHEHPWLAVRLTGTGTHTGAYEGVRATGRAVAVQELVVYRVEDGLIRECHGDLGAALHLALAATAP